MTTMRSTDPARARSAASGSDAKQGAAGRADPRARQAFSRNRARSAGRLSWYGHLIVYALSCLLIAVTAGPFVALIVALAWGIGVASHGFFAVAAPALHARWNPPAPEPSPPAASAGNNRTAEDQRARSLEELSAAIAHEIRNPITAAKSLVQQIVEDPRASDTVQHAQVALDELDRVERSIAHLLRYAREVPFEPTWLDVTELIDSAIELLRDRAQREQVRIERDSDALPQLFADGEQLRTVLSNLISNALDAHAAHQTRDARVRVSAGQNLAGTEVWVRVLDNGPGISQEAAAQIFRPFYTTKARGTGLGLALARKVLHRHGGSLELAGTATQGQGAEFILVLPRGGNSGAAQ